MGCQVHSLLKFHYTRARESRKAATGLLFPSIHFEPSLYLSTNVFIPWGLQQEEKEVLSFA